MNNTSSHLLNSIKSFFLQFLPKDREERLIFFLCILVYLPLGLYILYHTSIIDYPFPLTNIFFEFDNTLIYHVGTTATFKHPLMVYVTMPILYLGDILVIYFPKVKGILLVLNSNILISLSIVYVFRYLKDIVEISKSQIYYITIFFCLCNTCVYLSFTTESYPYALFLLSFTLWYFSIQIKMERKLDHLSVIFLAVLTGGLTITNGAKIIAASLFSGERIKRHFYRIGIVSVLFFLMSILGIILYSKIESEYKNEPINYKIMIQNLEAWSIHNDSASGNNSMKISDQFFGSPILMPKMIINKVERQRRDIPTITINQYKINIDFYNNYFYRILLLIFYSGILYCCWLNRTNKFLWMILSMFSIDFIIHIVMKYALHESFIYSGHWIFILPIIISWGIKKMNIKQIRVFNVTFILLAFFFLLNNILRLYDFILLAQKYYPPVS
ncbi:DUF6080 domain-containing protein [Dysgonomonas capnocytophagoides]|uniref:DUF6080 domain-containing protein n=1 Tax=Dysgonomonas capnocytophagoides TaxID=45254 RepID=UPI0030C8357B